jgi:glutamate-ammonia-ligase adenylyltransferase
MTERVVTSRGRLARLGFDDIDRAATLIGSLGDDPVPLLQTVATSAAPDQALALLADLAQTVDDPRQLIAALHADPVLRERLCLVLGASQALGHHLLRHPRHWHELRGDVPKKLSLRAATDADQLRVEYRRVLLRLAADDLSGVLDIDQVSAALADLAGQTVREALRLAGVELPDQAARCRLAVIGVGKCGGRELNYVSDVDVVFVAETAAGTDEATALRAASQLAARLIRICSEPAPWCGLWAATSVTTNGGRRPGSTRPCSRPGRSPATATSVRRTSRRSAHWSGRLPTDPASSRTSRPCDAGSSTRSRWHMATANSSSVPAACATSSSPFSCCSWCTGAVTRHCAAAPHSLRSMP